MREGVRVIVGVAVPVGVPVGVDVIVGVYVLVGVGVDCSLQVLYVTLPVVPRIVIELMLPEKDTGVNVLGFVYV